MKMRCTVACTFDPRLVSLLLSRSFNWEILLTNQAVMWDPSLTRGAWRNVLSLPTFQHLREPTASKSTSVECFMQQKLLVVFSKMKCKKRYMCIFSSFLKECVFTVDGQITHCDVFLYIFLVFFFIFQETKINCVRLATKGMWVSLFPAKHYTRNVKTTVVAQLDYSS